MPGATDNSFIRSLSRPERLSFVLMAVMLLLVGFLHMATLLLTGLFCYLALRAFSLGHSKLLGLVLFTLLMSALCGGMFYFVQQAYITFPRLAEETIPAVTAYAKQQGLELPFTDYAGLKSLAMEELADRFGSVGGYARAVVFQLAYFIIGVVVAVSLFFDARFRIEGDPHTESDNLYTLTGQELTQRFKTFYRSFATVMGAQILISTVNTLLTSVFLFSSGFPSPALLTAFTFLCGLLPIIGNIISNTVITAVAFTISPKMALLSLLFLMVIHKLEYFLNSKIIGHRIKNPMWMTLLGLLLGEKLMGIPGMILAPIVLHYIKVEASLKSAGKNE